MKILFAGLKYDYGIKSRGASLESKTFIPALENNSSQFSTFWFEENGFPNNIKKLQEKLIEYAQDFNPDLIFFVLMKDEISIETLRFLKENYKTLNWFCDDTWRFNDFTKFIAPEISYSVTNDKYSISNYLSIGCDNILLSQWACIDQNIDLNFQNIEYKYDISFVGAKNPTREWYISELRKFNFRVHCFGSGWDNGRVSFEQMKEIFLQSKINLNLSNSVPKDLPFLTYIVKRLIIDSISIKIIFNPINYYKKLRDTFNCLSFYFLGKKNNEQIKARNFEIPGYGGFQLSQYALELEDYYSIGSEIVIFNNVIELVKQCKYYLENEELRKTILINSYKKSLDHNYNNRIKDILLKIQGN